MPIYYLLCSLLKEMQSIKTINHFQYGNNASFRCVLIKSFEGYSVNLICIAHKRRYCLLYNLLLLIGWT